MGEEKPKMATSQEDFYRERLDDPGLLAGAILVGSYLAVPVGGKRKAGWLPYAVRERADEAVTQLAQHDGFPDPRVETDIGDLGGYEFYAFWGAPAPTRWAFGGSAFEYGKFNIARGRHYGYSERAIRRHLTEGNLARILDPELVQHLMGPDPDAE